MLDRARVACVTVRVRGLGLVRAARCRRRSTVTIHRSDSFFVFDGCRTAPLVHPSRRPRRRDAARASFRKRERTPARRHGPGIAADPPPSSLPRLRLRRQRHRAVTSSISPIICGTRGAGPATRDFAHAFSRASSIALVAPETLADAGAAGVLQSFLPLGKPSLARDATLQGTGFRFVTARVLT